MLFCRPSFLIMELPRVNNPELDAFEPWPKRFPNLRKAVKLIPDFPTRRQTDFRISELTPAQRRHASAQLGGGHGLGVHLGRMLGTYSWPSWRDSAVFWPGPRFLADSISSDTCCRMVRGAWPSPLLAMPEVSHRLPNLFSQVNLLVHYLKMVLPRIS